MSGATEQDLASMDSLSLSQMLVQLCKHDTNYQSSVDMIPMDTHLQRPYSHPPLANNRTIPQLILSSSRQSVMDEFLGLDEDLRSVDKDGPKGSRNPLSLSLKTLDGQMYVYNNGNRIQRQLVKYRHEETKTVLSLKQHSPPQLTLDSDANKDEVDLVQMYVSMDHHSIKIRNVLYGLTLTLEREELCCPQLVALTDVELKKRMAMASKKPGLVVDPVINMLYTTASVEPNQDTIALYYDIHDCYYYIDVDGTSLSLAREDKPNDPKKTFKHHLNFTVVHLGADQTDFSQLVSPDPDHRGGVSSLTGTPTQKPETRRFLSDPAHSPTSPQAQSSARSALKKLYTPGEIESVEGHVMDQSVPDGAGLMADLMADLSVDLGSEDTPDNE